jgi:hypothetical protein
MDINLTGRPQGEVPRYATVGRIVHVVDRDGGHQAAMITEVSPGRCDSKYVALTVFTPMGVHFLIDAVHDESQTPGTWHWPERN